MREPRTRNTTKILTRGLRNGELFYSLKKAKVLIEPWLHRYNIPVHSLKSIMCDTDYYPCRRI